MVMAEWCEDRSGCSGPLFRMKSLFRPGKNWMETTLDFNYILARLEIANEFLSAMIRYGHAAGSIKKWTEEVRGVKAFSPAK